MRNEGAICIHECASKHKIYYMFFSFWGLHPQTQLGLRPCTLLGEFHLQTPQLCPPNL